MEEILLLPEDKNKCIILLLRNMCNGKEQNNMNETIKNLTSRRSCRSFLDEHVDREVIDAIVAAGLNAPSGMTDTMGRMHSDAQFAGSSSVPAHVEMMGLIGAGNNPMVGMTVAVAVSIQEAAGAGKF